MSHILDALRQAEDERKLGAPPGATTIAGPLRHARRQRPERPWLLPLALLLAALLAAALLLMRGPPDRNESSPSAAAPSPAALADGQRPAAASTAPSLPAPQAAAAAPIATRPPAEPAAPATLPRARIAADARPQDIEALFRSPPPDEPPSSTAARRPTARPTESTPEPPGSEARSGPRSEPISEPIPEPRSRSGPEPLQPRDLLESLPSDLASARRLVGADEAGSADDRPARNGAAATPPSGAQAASQPDAAIEVDRLASAEAAGAPDFSIDVHVYHPDPELRFILANGRRVNQGQPLPGGAVLERILEDSIVIRWQGESLRRRIR